MPKPFNLSAGTKRKFEETKPFVPMAQMIEQFQKQTPARYHLRSRQRDEKGMFHLEGTLALTMRQAAKLTEVSVSRSITS